jgi:hypothetical protein
MIAANTPIGVLTVDASGDRISVAAASGTQFGRVAAAGLTNPNLALQDHAAAALVCTLRRVIKHYGRSIATTKNDKNRALYIKQHKNGI